MFIPGYVLSFLALLLIGYGLGRGKETGWVTKGLVEFLVGMFMLGFSIFLKN